MALIKCPECGNEVSDKAETCIHCGCPIETNQTVTCPECGQEVSSKAATCPNCGCPIKSSRFMQGKIIVQTENVFLGIGGRFLLYDKGKNLITKIKPGETYEMEIDVDTTLYIKTPSILSTFKPLESYAGQINRFSVSIPAGMVSDFCTVQRID